MLYDLDGTAPSMAPGAWVAPGAHVIGRVELAEAASVWFGAVLRGDNEPITLGARSNIQDGSVCHTDPGQPLVIGRDVTIGHKVILHGCTIGDRALVGMGSTVLNGAEVGEGCLVGAGSLITEGKSFPPGMLIMGTPARVVRALSESERAMIAASARIYVDNAARFQAGLTPLTQGVTEN
ncbi:gamma carbonic anhydrase family protein [Yunchengibacter salinarum]|uniref:gamma carbonic anhydrase family protein n=1 Tax=Yunchengibacter salinarum TaxID=3133399 RepID=UPI0035B57BD4